MTYGAFEASFLIANHYKTEPKEIKDLPVLSAIPCDTDATRNTPISPIFYMLLPTLMKKMMLKFLAITIHARYWKNT